MRRLAVVGLHLNVAAWVVLLQYVHRQTRRMGGRLICCCIICCGPFGIPRALRDSIDDLLSCNPFSRVTVTGNRPDRSTRDREAATPSSTTRSPGNAKKATAGGRNEEGRSPNKKEKERSRTSPAKSPREGERCARQPITEPACWYYVECGMPNILARLNPTENSTGRSSNLSRECWLFYPGTPTYNGLV